MFEAMRKAEAQQQGGNVSLCSAPLLKEFAKRYLDDGGDIPFQFVLTGNMKTTSAAARSEYGQTVSLTFEALYRFHSSAVA